MEDFVDSLQKYWSVFVAALLVGFFGYRYWPERQDEPPAMPPGVIVPPPPLLKTVPKAKSEDDYRPSWEREQKRASRPLDQPKVEIQERVIVLPVEETEEALPRTLTQDSPEVEEALSRLKIEIYGPSDSRDAEQVAGYFSHNRLPFSVHDTKDAMEKERARRLAGNGEGTVIVIDGQVLRGYSEEDLQQAILEATKRRVEK